MKTTREKIEFLIDNANGKIAAPILMYVLGVPGFLCILAWLFFFKGK
jgi:hypothetical protein